LDQLQNKLPTPLLDEKGMDLIDRVDWIDNQVNQKTSRLAKGIVYQISKRKD
jgi:hypothetical protein